MSALADWAEKAVLDWLMGGATPTRPAGRYVALFTTATSDSGGGTEVSGSGYTRQAATFDAASSPGGTTQNSGTITFTASGGSWGTITHMAIYDASSGGNMIWHGPLQASKTIGDGDSLQFTAGTIDLVVA